MNGPLGLSIQVGRLRQTRPREYLIRFAFGGLVTVGAGLVGNWWGAAIGGLFLAFPSILPASLTLIKDHAKLSGAAGADALGAALGSLGLVAFALVGWQLSTSLSGWLMLIVALAIWLVLAGAAWIVFQAWHSSRRNAKQAHTRGHLKPDQTPRHV
ncbi:MAG: DUF3147 family protein [Chloroflexi bacterium]|nr:DUF3147 family protein [Chloroflexota bacterium]